MQPYRCASARKRCLNDPLSDQQFIYFFFLHLIQNCVAHLLYSLCRSRLDVDLANLTQCLRRRSCRSFSLDAAALGVFFWVFPNLFFRDSDNRERGFSELEQELRFHDISALSRGGSIFTSKLSGINGIDGVDASSLFSIGALHRCGNGSDHSVLHPNHIQYGYQKEVLTSQFECWGDSGVVATSPVTDTSTNVDLEDNNQFTLVGKDLCSPSANVMNRSKEMAGGQKTLRRLVQNREAARKSRLRKKAYVQQLESSRVKLVQIEEEIRRARQQGIFIASGCSGDQRQGFLAFDLEYVRWLDLHQRHINDLRSAVDSRVSDNELCVLVDGVMAHYDEIFRLKSVGAKADVFHLLSGMWTTPAERCVMWLGGFRSSELLKLLVGQLEPLTDQQLVGLCNLQQSSQQAEDALTQGMEALQQSLSETIASGSLGGCTCMSNVTDYMGQMAVAMSNLGMLENFLRQADLLRQQTLQQMYRILTTRQAARALLAINDYFSRLRALSSLWLARPRE